MRPSAQRQGLAALLALGLVSFAGVALLPKYMYRAGRQAAPPAPALVEAPAPAARPPPGAALAQVPSPALARAAALAPSPVPVPAPALAAAVALTRPPAGPRGPPANAAPVVKASPAMRTGLLLAGDSNMRLILGPLTEALATRKCHRKFTYPTDAQAEKKNTRLFKGKRQPWGWCTSPDWCDHEWLYVCDDADGPFGSSLAVMFKFMHSQDDVGQLLNLSDFRMCGRRSRDELNSYTMEPICGNAPRFTADGVAKALHPPHPTLAWVAHGLWGHDISLASEYLPVSSKPDDVKNCRKTNSCKFGNCAPFECPRDMAECEARFAVHKRTLGALSQLGIPAIWQTLFPIRAHPVLTNQFLHSDYLCQKIVAQRAGIVVGDVPQITGLESWSQNGVSGDWHLNKNQVNAMVKAILDALQAAASARRAFALQGGTVTIPTMADSAWVATRTLESEEQLLALLKSNAP